MENPIKTICKKHKMSRAEIHRETGIPYPTLSVLVSGKGMEFPGYQTAQRLCHFLEVSPGVFLDMYAEWKASQETSQKNVSKN